MRINDLDYADDIALFETSLAQAQQQLQETSNNANRVGLEINIGKTKLMALNCDGQDTISLNDEKIERVSDFKYLGSMMASEVEDLKYRKNQAWAAFWKLKKIWYSRTTVLSLKIRIFQASCISILLYGSETWILTDRMKNQLDSFATSCYRIMLGIKRTDKITNEWLYCRTGQIPISNTVASRQLTWIVIDMHTCCVEEKRSP